MLAKFQDPNSPYHIPAGSTGPQHENDHSKSRPLPFNLTNSKTPSGDNKGKRKAIFTPEIQWSEPESSENVEGLKSSQYRASEERLSIGREGAHRYFEENGYDSDGILEWNVAWGDCDMFQSVTSPFESLSWSFAR